MCIIEVVDHLIWQWSLLYPTYFETEPGVSVLGRRHLDLYTSMVFLAFNKRCRATAFRRKNNHDRIYKMSRKKRQNEIAKMK